ncbi:hypothetical protein GALL_153050 [mine drainage metagenome]|uniref:Uncharacterized protein n=1 Tax=mine drainage metagenome TaxID=410659 RepID=A0A1J5S2W5_9ZZZZ
MLSSALPSMATQAQIAACRNAELAAEAERAAAHAQEIADRRKKTLRVAKKSNLRPRLTDALSRNGAMALGDMRRTFTDVSLETIKGVLRVMLAAKEISRSGKRGNYTYSLSTQKKGIQ